MCHWIGLRPFQDRRTRKSSLWSYMIMCSAEPAAEVVVSPHTILDQSAWLTWVRRPSMDVKRTEVAGNLFLRLEANVFEVLVAKYKCASLRSKQGELI